MIIRLAALAISSLVLCSACVTPPKGPQSSLEIQAFQQKEFEAAKGVAFGSVVSVFQDLGYIVQSADKDTGFITANSPMTNKTGFWDAMGGVAQGGNTRATAFIEEIRPGFTTVRLNFVNSQKASTAYGQSHEADKPIMDPKPYQVAFNKIEDAIFIRSGTSAKSTQSTQ